ncbi:MAG: diguanylate cyclase [Betaproteobacteria bacterium]
MNVLEQIRGQREAVNLPLYAVTVTAVPRPDTPVLLMLHWHGFRRDFLFNAPAAEPVAYRSVASSALQLNERWRALDTIDLAAMEAGWEMGAWDVARLQRRSCMRPGADTSKALECLQAFGSVPESMGGRDLVISEAPDVDELIKLAASVGYLTWQFRPVVGGIWADVANDVTLNSDGSRSGPCPLLPEPASRKPVSKTVYRFGHSGNRTVN